jgi:hypothetical protein
LGVITLLVVALAATVASTACVVAFGQRWRRTGFVRALATAGLGTVTVGELVARGLGLPSGQVLVAEAVLVAAALAVWWLRWPWNPLGVWFFANLVVTEVAYVGYAGWLTVFGGLEPVGAALSGVLLVLETAGLLLAATFAFEICDVVCRTRGERQVPYRDDGYRPFVSIHVAAYNEPPDMLIDTIRSLEELDYPDLEIVVVDNNTELPEVWKPVEEYCTDRPWLRFVHVAPWPGYKSGALNLALAECTDPRAAIVGIVDADYLVDADWLADIVGWFADPAVAFVQTPQDYADWEGDAYLTACHDAYAYFFATSMRSRNQRNAPIFAGTMGLIRRSVLDDIGGWDEWCITEDAEASLRILAAGYEGVYVHRSYGQGIMPLTFDALKRQRFRWCFGGIQILRKHWRRLVPWQRRPDDWLSTSQRLDFLVGGLQWGADLVALGFAVVLAASVLAVATGHPFGLRPLAGPAIVVPLVLTVASGLRAVWALRAVNGISMRRALLAYANWLSLSLTVAYATARGIARRDGVFLRTPKWRPDGGLLDALRASLPETALAGVLALVAVAAVAVGGAWPLAVFAAWEATVYAMAPAMAWLNLHTELNARLARRQRTEERRERRSSGPARLAPAAVALAVVAAAGLAALAVTYPATTSGIDLPARSPGDAGPLGNLGVLPSDDGGSGSGGSGVPTTAVGAGDGTAGTGAGGTTTSTPASSGTTSTTAAATTTTVPATPSATRPTATSTPSTVPESPTTTDHTPGPPTSTPGNGHP